jgi:hypothetical protein
MKRAMFLLAGLVMLAAVAFAQVPVINTIDPGEAKPGEVITAVGVHLESAKVSEVYLTDGINDIKMVVVEQKAESLKFKIPNDAKAGVYNLMLATVSNPPILLVQPVKCTVTHTEVE